MGPWPIKSDGTLLFGWDHGKTNGPWIKGLIHHVNPIWTKEQITWFFKLFFKNIVFWKCNCPNLKFYFMFLFNHGRGIQMFFEILISPLWLWIFSIIHGWKKLHWEIELSTNNSNEKNFNTLKSI
jgi:hypothetical protein